MTLTSRSRGKSGSKQYYGCERAMVSRRGRTALPGDREE